MIGEADKSNLKIGFKEVMKLIAENRASKVVVAHDCDDKIKNQISQAANSAAIEIEYSDTMKSLGKLCGIDVGASCAAVKKF